jgi:hypothetical protein
MAEAVFRWPVILVALIPSHTSPFGIFGGQNGTGTGFPLSVFVFFCQYQCINTLYSFIFTDV